MSNKLFRPLSIRGWCELNVPVEFTLSASGSDFQYAFGPTLSLGEGASGVVWPFDAKKRHMQFFTQPSFFEVVFNHEESSEVIYLNGEATLGFQYLDLNGRVFNGDESRSFLSHSSRARRSTSKPSARTGMPWKSAFQGLRVTAWSYLRNGSKQNSMLIP